MVISFFPSRASFPIAIITSPAFYKHFFPAILETSVAIKTFMTALAKKWIAFEPLKFFNIKNNCFYNVYHGVSPFINSLLEILCSLYKGVNHEE